MPKLQMPDGAVIDFGERPDAEVKAIIRRNYPDYQFPDEKKERSLSGFGDNLAANARDIWERGSGALSRSVENRGVAGTALKIADMAVGTPIGMVQEMIPGQRPDSYETQYADPLFKAVNKDLGIGWDRNAGGPIGLPTLDTKVALDTAYERPLDFAMSAATFTGPAGVGKNAVSTALRQASRYTNPVNFAGKGLTTVAKKGITPSPTDPRTIAAGKRLKQRGIDATAGQITNSPGTKFWETNYGGKKIANVVQDQHAQFTREVARMAGIDADNITRQVRDTRYRKFKSDFDSFTYGRALQADPQAVNAIRAGVNGYRMSGDPISPYVLRYVDNVMQRAGQGMHATVYKNVRERLTAQIRRPGTTPAVKDLLGDVVEALDDTASKTIPASELQRFRRLRSEYKHYKIIEDALLNPDAEFGSVGYLTPRSVGQAASRGQRRGSYGKRGDDLAQLVDDAKHIVGNPLPQTGAWPRRIAAGLSAGGGAALAGAAGAVGGFAGAAAMGPAALGLAAGSVLPWAVGKFINSKAGQAYAKNQLLPWDTMSKRPGQIAGVAARTIAGAGDMRERTLQHAEDVLSANVLNHVKKTPALRKPFSSWLKAKETGGNEEEARRLLAQAIADDLGVPDLADRIVQELGDK